MPEFLEKLAERMGEMIDRETEPAEQQKLSYLEMFRRLKNADNESE